MRPATSLIGASSGSAPSAQLHGLVGDAGDLVLEQRVGHRRVGGEVQVGEQAEPGRMEPNSLAEGSFTLQTMSARSHTSAAVGTISAPARR